MKFYFWVLVLFNLINYLANSHGIHEEEEEGEEHDHAHVEGEAEDHEDEKTYASYVTLIGIILILACSFAGTVLPILLKKKAFFKEDTVFFGSLKLFGCGVIISVAFIHMLVPADQLLTSKYSFTFFNDTYPSFAGAFAIIGIILTHLVQTYSSHFLYKNYFNKHGHVCKTDNLITEKKAIKSNEVVDRHDSIVTVATEDGDLSDAKAISLPNDIKTHACITEDGIAHTHSPDQQPHVHVNVYGYQGDACAEGQHGILALMENKEKQLICYLLEMGISFHSVLIGIAFGLENGSELISLLVAVMFHQFFEGIALSSIFVEAHFKHLHSILCMVLVYTCTMPIGGVIGLIIRSSMDPLDKSYITLQGSIDAIAAGVLIFDSLVNVLSRHCNSSIWHNTTLQSKSVQLFFLYCGLAVMAIIGLWA